MEEVENMGSRVMTSNKDEEDDHVTPPGFRFHPTDEELVGFYLRRKVEKRPISIELIKQADIYKYDPWNLPKSSVNVGDKEWYFFCKRGRKYRNSIRPNRVTVSGFWKATGIDRPIYNSSGGRDCIIGLKKSLVYYLGSAGKGTKTDWMMHEFRLPLTHAKSTNHTDAKIIAQEAEVWTLCRILKRSISYRKCIPERSNSVLVDHNNAASSKTCSVDSSDHNNNNMISQSRYISFSNSTTTAPLLMKQNEKKPYSTNNFQVDQNTPNQQFFGSFTSSSIVSQAPSVASSFSSSISGDMNELIKHADWEDIRSIMDYATTNYNPFYM